MMWHTAPFLSYRTVSNFVVALSRVAIDRSFVDVPRSLFERGHHLMRENLQGARLLPLRQESTGIQLRRDPVQAELFAKLRETVDQPRARAERDLGAQDLRVREARQGPGLSHSSLGRAGPGTTDRRSGQVGLAVEVVRDGLLRLFHGGLLRGRGVHRNPEAYVAITGVPRLSPRLAVTSHVSRQLGDVHAAQPDENGQTHPADARKGVRGRRGHPDRRMRLLIRARGDGGVGEAIELAFVAEGLALPRREDDLQRFEEASLTLFVGDAERVVGPRASAAANAEVEPSVAQMIERGDLAGDAERVVQRKKLNRRPHAQALGPRDDPARHQQGRRQYGTRGIDEHLRQPHDVEPPRLRRVDELEQLAERLTLTAPTSYLLREDSEVHGVPLLAKDTAVTTRQIPRSARNLA